MITLPKLLDSNGAESGRIRPVSLSISEHIIPLSTASMVLPAGQSIPDRSYLELFTVNGSAGIFRARVPKTGYRQESTYQLEHAICEVGDWLVRANIEKTQKTLSQALAQVFDYYGGSKWQLGTVSAEGNVILSANYANLLQTMNSLIAQVNGAVMTFDFTATPWMINVVSLPETVTAEGRLSRNIRNAEIRKDDSDLCTRVWLEGLENGYMDADTVSTYGVIEKRLNGDYTAEQAAIVAAAYLAKYKRPAYSVSIDGVDFSSITGEALDKVELGKLYRLTVPEDNLVIERNIVSIEWRDVLNAPNLVTITLSEPESTIVDFIRKQEREQTGAGGYYESQQAANEAIRTEVAETASQLRLEVQESESRIESAVEQQIVVVRSEVESAASGIWSYVYANNSQVWSSVTQTANQIRTEVHNDLSNFYTAIMQSASQVTIRTGDSNRTFNQQTAPTGTTQDPLVDGDVWFKNAGQFTWGDAADKYWLDDTTFDWGELKTAEIYRYDGTSDQWKKVSDERGLLQDTRFQQNKEEISMVAGRVDVVDGKVESYRGEFNVRADQITSSVTEQVGGLRSDIRQTVSEIRASVSAANSQIYTAISQTASQILLTAENQVDGVRSELQVTASQIRSSVSASNSQLYSYIQQTATNISMVVANTASGLRSELSITASQIRSEVSNSVSSLRSSITVESNRISLVVEGTGANAKIKPASIVAAINNGASSIIISADHINLDGYVKATDITADFISGKIAQLSMLNVTAMNANSAGGITSGGVGWFTGGLRVGSGTTFASCLVGASVSGNTLTLTDSGGGTVTFSKATTLSGAWGSGVFTASASPQGNTLTTSLTVGQFIESGSTIKAKIYATIGSSGVVYDTGKEVDASSVYTAGVNSVYATGATYASKVDMGSHYLVYVNCYISNSTTPRQYSIQVPK